MRIVAAIAIAAALGGLLYWRFHYRVAPQTVEQVVAKTGAEATKDLRAAAKANGISWPPKKLCLLAFKSERLIEVWVANADGEFRFLKEYPVLGISGGPGPKRRSGDKQVPEGFYKLDALNPNSRYHLSIRVSYPNQEDIENSKLDRSEMGGDIFVHGSDVSIGCLAIGNDAIEEVFNIAALVPASKREIIISPVDFRKGKTATADEEWVRGLYSHLAEALKDFER